MNIREQIENTFDGKAFKRPLFYNYEGGLRFELSEGGNYLNKFLTAHRKAMEVCSQIFSGCEDITVCTRVYGGKRLLSSLSTLRPLREAGLYPISGKEHWTEFDEEWLGDEDYSDSLWHYIAFNAPSEYIINALWCALSSDFGCINPNPMADIYLFNLSKEVMVFPYDDRGMDIVGPNKQFLKELYDQFEQYLLDYDKEAMDAAFGENP
ncbi:DUF3885 domain-containing protein [Microbulbifer thermotolerans]|uniref:DUF3885 domain-containing protein n=1 Tax=Microbulbifer thermotolerans TaxID=252514 RepID=UPI002248FD19|nr:DUF3885 domain-containing protein [Microbulbifer thermotolerans]MCX2796502.1 DUF3885 domain-containing protein [Microbulbifer thermotolerans]